MNSSIKLAIVAAIAAAGLAACTSVPEQHAAPVTQTSIPTSSQAPSETPGTPPPSVVVETVTVTNPPKPQAVVKTDNRLGYGSLKLGMTLEEARATGQTNLTWDSDGDSLCVSDSSAAISRKYGVERISLPADAKTSRGIGVGSTFAEVRKAYPDTFEYRAGLTANLDGNVRYAFIGTDKVLSIKIFAGAGHCAMAQL